MKCANCKKDAMYEYKITTDKSVFYCGNDLPAFLDARKKAGLLTLTPKNSESLTSALDVLSTPTPEAPVVEEPKPVKKATKKTEK
jgi:hypothetical protein